MFENQKKFSDKEKVKFNKLRRLHDAKMIEAGAKVTPDDRIVPETDENVEQIKKGERELLKNPEEAMKIIRKNIEESIGENFDNKRSLIEGHVDHIKDAFWDYFDEDLLDEEIRIIVKRDGFHGGKTDGVVYLCNIPIIDFKTSFDELGFDEFEFLSTFPKAFERLISLKDIDLEEEN